MNKFRFLWVGLLFIFLPAVAADNLPKLFYSLLDRGKMTFVKPFGFLETKIAPVKQMNYEYAFKQENKNFEVRLAIRPLDELIKEYEAKLKIKKTHDSAVDPNTIYQGTFQAVLRNITGGKLPDITLFRKDEARTEFNADWGASAFLEVGNEFGADYKYCMVVAIHKDNCADAYYYYLGDNKDTFPDQMQLAYYSLKFK